MKKTVVGSQHGQFNFQAPSARAGAGGDAAASLQCEKSYWYWIRYFFRFHQLRHPLEMGAGEVNAFLRWLVVERKVAAATRNLALNALVFLYARVLQQPLGQVGEVVRAKRSTRIPRVLTHAKASEILALRAQPYQLLASLGYGAGLRVVEAARLRVRDLDFDRQATAAPCALRGWRLNGKRQGVTAVLTG